MTKLLLVLAGISWIACLAVSVMRFVGTLDDAGYKSALLAASLAWFVFATAAAYRGSGGSSPG